MTWLVFCKEFLELKSQKGAIRRLCLQSVTYGLLFPAVMYARHIGLMPVLSAVPIEQHGEQQRLAVMMQALSFVGVLLMPSLISLVAAQLSIPSIAQEVQSRTLERLLSLPLSWRNIFFGKLLFYFAASLASAYMIVLAYFSVSMAIVESFVPPHVLLYLLILVPTVVFYAVSAGLFASARARSVTVANISGGFLTWVLFFGAFFAAWSMGMELGRDFILAVGFMLFSIGFTLAYLTAGLDPERLLYGPSSHHSRARVQAPR